MTDVVVYRKRRGVELVMLLFAMTIAVSGYLLTELNINGDLSAEWPWAVGTYVGIGLAAHAVVRWRLPFADPLLLPCVYLLNGLGLAMIHRLDLGSAQRLHSAELQLTWTAIAVGVFCAFVLLLGDHRRLQRFPYLLFLGGLALLMSPLVPGLGVDKHGAQIWIHIGSWNFQPAELAKIVLSIAFASYLVEKREVLALAGARILGIDLPRPRDLGPILVMWLASLAILVFQRDLGTSLLFFGLFVTMLYIATERPSWPILGLVMFLGGAALGYRYFGHVQIRVNAWLNPFSDVEANYQIIQGQYGLAWGGLFGTGWGLGRPNLTPLAKNDYIAAALGEELGIAGLMAIIVIYGVIVARGLRAALASREPFGKLLAAGLAFVFAIQVFVIIGGITRLLPLTGLTTPFLSQGGSSLIANWLLLGLLLTITHQVRAPLAQVTNEPVASLAHETTQVIAVSELDRRESQPEADQPAPAVATAPQAADDLIQAIPPASTLDAPTADVATPALDAATADVATPSPDAPTQAAPAPAAALSESAAVASESSAEADDAEHTQAFAPVWDDTNPRGQRP